MSKTDERLYQIACSFPALKHKGVDRGRIAGITPTDFFDLDLAAWLYEGGGGLKKVFLLQTAVFIYS